MNRDVEELKVPNLIKPQAEKIMDSRVKKKTRHKIYMEHLVEWRKQLESEVTWIPESDFKKHGIIEEFLRP